MPTNAEEMIEWLMSCDDHTIDGTGNVREAAEKVAALLECDVGDYYSKNFNHYPRVYFSRHTGSVEGTGGHGEEEISFDEFLEITESRKCDDISSFSPDAISILF